MSTVHPLERATDCVAAYGLSLSGFRLALSPVVMLVVAFFLLSSLIASMLRRSESTTRTMVDADASVRAPSERRLRAVA